METKVCTRCEVEKPLDGFSKQKGGKFGRNSHCKECRSEHNKQYRQTNREAVAAYQKQYRQTNREAVAAYQKQYYEANRGAKAEYKKQYYEANREALVEYSRQYYEANREANREAVAEYKKQYYRDNPDLFRAHRHKRRQRLANAEHDPQVTRESLRDRYGTQCAYCGCVMNFDTDDYRIEYDPTHVNIEHIHPLSNGGAFTFDNTLLVCRRCNNSKKNKSATEFLELTDDEILFCQDLVILFPKFLD